MFIDLSPSVAVAPQISADDVAAARAAGFTLVINNRPDGEAAGQPGSAEIEAAAKAAGVGYAHIPLVNGALTPGHVEAVRGALDTAGDGRALMFCRSGTRSAMLWGLAEALGGGDPDAAAAAARNAGYDLSPVMGLMRQLAAA
jgi:uncharacterized protein (TIGR01244 family)